MREKTYKFCCTMFMIVNKMVRKTEIIQREPFIRKRTIIIEELSSMWIVGFSEGEGCFTRHYTYNKKLGKRYTSPRFDICQKDREILEKIREYFGFGFVTKKYQNNGYHYIVIGKKNCLKILEFFDGKIQSKEKKEQFEKWKNADFW